MQAIDPDFFPAKAPLSEYRGLPISHRASDPKKSVQEYSFSCNPCELELPEGTGVKALTAWELAQMLTNREHFDNEFSIFVMRS